MGKKGKKKKREKQIYTPIIDLAEDLLVLLVKVPFKLLRNTKKVLVEVSKRGENVDLKGKLAGLRRWLNQFPLVRSPCEG